MAEDRKLVRVFLASPGDMVQERQIAKRVVDEHNRQWADHFGIHVELVGWEDTTPGFGRPQSLINADLDRCDFFIGMIWKWFGSRPDKNPGDSPYSSGFEEEYMRSIHARKTSGRPEIYLFFKEIPQDHIKDPSEQVRKVIEFKSKITAERQILYQEFKELQDFASHIRNCLAAIIKRLSNEKMERPAEETAGIKPLALLEQSIDEPTESKLFSDEAAAFIRCMAEAKSPTLEAGGPSPLQIARFRLLASLAHTTSNDKVSIGVHDANIIYHSHHNIDLSHAENYALADVGLKNYKNANVPVWYWLGKMNDLSSFLTLSTLWGDNDSIITAFKICRYLGYKYVPTFLTKEKQRLIWFDSKSASEIRESAADYLAELGTLEDIGILETEYSRGDFRTEAAAVRAIISIYARKSAQEAIDKLVDLEPDELPDQLFQGLLSAFEASDSSVLRRALTQKNAKVRARALEALEARSELAADTTEPFLKDADLSVRRAALRALRRLGREFSDGEIAEVLRYQAGPSASHLFNLGFGVRRIDDKVEEATRAQLREKYKEMTLRQIRRAMSGETILSQFARFSLEAKLFNERGHSLRMAFDNEFVDELNAEIANLKAASDPSSEAAERILSASKEIRKERTRLALDVICEFGDKTDIHRVRKWIDSESGPVNDAQIDYLKRHGEWEDIQRLLKLPSRAERPRGLLAIGDIKKDVSVASAIYAIGHQRLNDMIQEIESDTILSYIILTCSIDDIKSLSMKNVLFLLSRESETTRNAICLKLLRTFGRARISLIQRSYTEKNQQFYSVIHWLDLGLSMPRIIVRKVVDGTIKNLLEAYNGR